MTVPRYLLDTNICIYIAKHNPPEVRQHFSVHPREHLAMSVITLGELRHGAEKSQSREKAIMVLSQLIEVIQVLDVPVEAGVCYGQIRAMLEKQGQIIGNNDLWISAHALASGLILVTNNVREFSRVADLKIENWAI
ncbi:MAG: type II toxin-antitoxin system VapC family toxin [Desulfosalsimonadaceae bacterium]|nr:type II toxin-antitoxin system VapC family toxin [Desulfosalsimonadaceae bacterium]